MNRVRRFGKRLRSAFRRLFVCRSFCENYDDSDSDYESDILMENSITSSSRTTTIESLFLWCSDTEQETLEGGEEVGEENADEGIDGNFEFDVKDERTDDTPENDEDYFDICPVKYRRVKGKKEYRRRRQEFLNNDPFNTSRSAFKYANKTKRKLHQEAGRKLTR